MSHAAPQTDSTGATYTARHAENVPGGPSTGDRAPNSMSAHESTPAEGESDSGRSGVEEWTDRQVRQFLNRQGDLIADYARSSDLGDLDTRVSHLRRAAKEAEFTADVLEMFVEDEIAGGDSSE